MHKRCVPPFPIALVMAPPFDADPGRHLTFAAHLLPRPEIFPHPGSTAESTSTNRASSSRSPGRRPGRFSGGHHRSASSCSTSADYFSRLLRWLRFEKELPLQGRSIGGDNSPWPARSN